MKNLLKGLDPMTLLKQFSGQMRSVLIPSDGGNKRCFIVLPEGESVVIMSGDYELGKSPEDPPIIVSNLVRIDKKNSDKN